jgi:hypothetical protein
LNIYEISAQIDQGATPGRKSSRGNEIESHRSQNQAKYEKHEIYEKTEKCT